MKHASLDAAQKNKALMDRLSRVEGQLRGIRKMIEEDVYCDDIINQIEASRSALKAIELILIENHIHHCIVDEVKADDLSGINAMIETLRKMVK
jgi:CsoR family transcriptional regulator, copper-sensing transcriptional repressor